MKKRRLSILLSILMLFSLLPTTVLAAGNPEASSVFVDGDKNFYNPGRLYYNNGDSKNSFSGSKTSYNAAYDPATGTLKLDGYSGGSISVGGTGNPDIIVVLEGTNIINGSLTNEVGGDITITSDSGGKLSITKTISDSNAAIGIETGWSSSYDIGNVTITGNAEVTIDMKHNGTSTYERAYGIYAEEDITISRDASVDITCATPNNTTGGDRCNGLRADQNVTIDTNGTIKIDVTNAGKDKDNGYSFGVVPMGTATLTKVGNMEVQWKKEGNSTMYSGGTFTKKATFSGTDHAINVDTTNCYASYRKGTPYTVRVQNGTLTGTGVVSYAKNSGNFLAGDKVSITPDTKKGKSKEVIPFEKWTSSDVTFDQLATLSNNSFTVPGNNVTVTAMHSPFVGAPVFTRTDDSKGTIAFQTVAKPDGGAEYFEYVKVGKENDPYEYRSIAPQPTPVSTVSPYKYSVSASNYYTGGISNIWRPAITVWQ